MVYNNLYKWGLSAGFEQEAQIYEGLFPLYIGHEKRGQI